MTALLEALYGVLPARQVIGDELRRVAYGTDASFYRLIPEVVAIVHNEQEVQDVLAVARRYRRALTFRAAGTSLSGQAITDGILALIGEGFESCEISPDATLVRLGPATIGAEANRRLAPFNRKIGPDPASINSCKIGGIAANNASGMCCGTAQNSYRTLAGLRLVLADGTLLDSEDEESVARFRQSHAGLVSELEALAAATRADAALAERIRHKFRIKNTTGYSLNALVDYEDAIDILAHLMIGSEGTLAFISRITYRTVSEEPFKASALVFFPDIAAACRATILMKAQAEAPAAVELLDRAALRSVEAKPGMPAAIAALGGTAAALLIELRAGNAPLLQESCAATCATLANVPTIAPPAFTSDPQTCAMYWNVRKGTFPSVGAMRRAGTSVIIEDVAFPIESLAAATLDLQALLKKHGYEEAIIFGHALEGNLHFVFTQDFGIPAEVNRYAALMHELCDLVVGKYDGSLKAEHGTGRNMAPFVELEWGYQATNLMRRIKNLFDPDNLLSPGVILTDDAQAHLKNLKPLPVADELVDRCIECGFCEPVCPSHQLTFSPRQRIVAWREFSRRAAGGESATGLEEGFAYQGLATCAGCGMCESACPVGIDTGELIRRLRSRKLGGGARALGTWAAGNFGALTAIARGGLRLGHLAAAVLGGERLAHLSRGAWKKGMPQAGKEARPRGAESGDPVVYFPACGGRMFGPNAAGEPALSDVVGALLSRAGYAPRLPENLATLCCGQMLESKGLAQDAETMAGSLADALMKAAADGSGGFYPVLIDASPCSRRMQKRLAGRLAIFDFHEFAQAALLPRLTITRKSGPIALHVNCSVRRGPTADTLRALVAACCETVVEPEDIACCGFGGDRGFAVAELNAHALRHVHSALPADCREGVSTNRTCEIGLTSETGRPYRSVAYLLEECSRPSI